VIDRFIDKRSFTMNAPLNTVAVNSVLASMTSDIDALYVLDQQSKALAEQVKAMKADIANKYGEGKHEGENHSVDIKLVAVSGNVDYTALCLKYGITDAELDTFRKEGRADIRVTPKK
jgi:hypothetical protein